MQRIVIVGGGFAGMATARGLERILQPQEAAITVVSSENYTLFTPMLPEIGSGTLEARHVVTPIRAELRRAEFVLGNVCAIDLKARSLALEHPVVHSRSTLAFDQLVLALGSVVSTFGLPGISERSFPYKTLEDAEALRNHVIAMLEVAAVTSDRKERARLLTLVFVGGGFTGVEAAGEMSDLFRSTLRYYPTIAASDVRIVLVEGGPTLLPDLQAGMGAYSERSLRKRGIEVQTSRMVSGADERGIRFREGPPIETATIVWSAGVRPSPAVAALGIETGRGGAVVTNPDFSLPGYEGLWAIGDCAAIPSPSGAPYPATAQHAIREGPVLARNIAARLRGQATEPFRYETIGMMASLGARRGVAGLRGRFLLTGFPAWILWRTYYLLRLPGLDRQLRVAFDWTLGLFFPRDIAELRMSSREEAMLPPDALRSPASAGRSSA
ncbi:MAG: NAD(P)/FAD-dependent oxidoreductase [Vulcanimicrobiaceae bacterium]